MTLPASSRFQFAPDLSDLPHPQRDVAGLRRAWPHRPGARGRPRCSPITTPDSRPGTSPTITAPPRISSASFRREFAARHGAQRLSEIQAFTKWVPRPGRDDATQSSTRRSASRSRAWASSASTSCNSIGGTTPIAATSTRSSISPTCSDEGKIRHLALTNFDTERLRDHHRARHSRSSRTRCSIRWSIAGPRRGWRRSAAITTSRLLTYGTVLGGLLSEKYLGRPEPRSRRAQHRLAAEIQAT